MNKRHIVYMAVLIIFLIILSNLYKITNSDVLEIYSFRQPFILGETLYINDFYNSNLYKNNITSPSNQTEDKFFPYKRLSKEQAKEDVDFLLRELEDKYALYKTINNKGKLNLAKDRIYEDIYDSMTSKELEIILLRHLIYIDDAHFLINNRKLKPNFITQIAEGIIIDKIDNEYYLNNEKIENIDQLTEYVKPSINNNGEIEYKLFFKKKEISEKPINEIIMESGKKLNIIWRSTNNLDHETLNPEYYETDYYGVLKVKEFYHPKDEQYQDYVMTKIQDLTKKKYQVLDLRGNQGGNGVLASGLFYNYSGYKPVYSHDNIININMDKFINAGDGDDINLIRSHLKFMGYEKVDDNTFILRKSDKVYKKAEPIFILVDGSTSSASEHLIDMFKHISNSIVVGIPTSGTMKSSTAYNITLNNSYITVSFGNMYVNYNEEYFKEFYGFEPDIWVESENAEENIIKFINNIINEDN